MDFIDQEQQVLLNRELQISQEKERKCKITREYHKIPFETKVQIVNLIQNQKLPLHEVSQQLKVKVCTCKQILRKYEEEGKIKRKSKRREKIEIDVKLKVKIIHPLNLKEHENLSTLKTKIFTKKKDLNKSELEELESLIMEKLEISVGNLQRLWQTKISSENYSFLQEKFNTQAIQSNIGKTLQFLYNKICSKSFILKNKKVTVNTSLEQLFGSLEQGNNRNFLNFFFSLLEKNNDIQNQYMQTNLQKLAPNYIHIQTILDQIVNKSKQNDNIARQIDFLTQESIRLFKKLAFYQVQQGQVDNMAEAIKKILKESFS